MKISSHHPRPSAHQPSIREERRIDAPRSERDTEIKAEKGRSRSSGEHRQVEQQRGWYASSLFNKVGTIRSRAEVGTELRAAGVRVTDKARVPLSLNRRQVEEIRSAPTREAAAARAMEILQKKSGVEPTGTHYGLDWRRYDSRTATVNALLGTSIAHDPRKSDAAADILSRMAGSMAKTLRAGREHDCPDDKPYRTPGAGHTTIDLGEYLCAARMAAELQSPLIFDLTGRGFCLHGGHRVGIDLDGDGQEELISDLDDDIGLLVIAPDPEATGEAAAFFGDRSDLSRWGVSAPRQDGAWDDGFMALRALVEHLAMLRPDKQYLDVEDITRLQDTVGLRMRVGGIRGREVLLTDLGISRIDLGSAEDTQRIEDASIDAIGNRFMRQEGATFVIDGEVRDYVDIWFAVHARTAASVDNAATA